MPPSPYPPAAGALPAIARAASSAGWSGAKGRTSSSSPATAPEAWQARSGVDGRNKPCPKWTNIAAAIPHRPMLRANRVRIDGESERTKVEYRRCGDIRTPRRTNRDDDARHDDTTCVTRQILALGCSKARSLESSRHPLNRLQDPA